MVQTTHDQHVGTERIQHARIAAPIVDNLLQRLLGERRVG
jgi:hypothetical protein